MQTNRDQWPPHIQARYPEEKKSWFLFIVGSIFVLIIGAFIAVGVERVINPPLYEKLLAWEIKDANSVSVTFEISRPIDMNVWCLIRAQNEDKFDVGYAVLAFPQNGQQYLQTNYLLKTYETAYVAEVINCDDDPKSTLFPLANFLTTEKLPNQDPPAIFSGN